MSKPWTAVGAAGAWALDAERAEAEEAERAAASAAVVSSASHSSVFDGDPVQIFPGPKSAAAKTTARKKKKKKGIAVPLSVFTTNTYVSPGGSRREPSFDPNGISGDPMLFLPTAPCEHAAGELENSRNGGGFRSYGGGSPRRFNEDRGRRPPASRVSDLEIPSRADEADNWASVKKPNGRTMDSGRRDRCSPLGNAASSKADEVDNWSSEKKSAVPPSGHSGFGSGFREETGMDSDRWGRGVGSLSSNAVGERPKLVLHPPKNGSESPLEPPRSRPNPFSAARPREEVLAEKGLDWRKMQTEIEMKKTGMSTTSSHSSRQASDQSSLTGSPVSQVSGEVEKLKTGPKINPFGDAKPREVLLEEKGKDWRKIDRELEHRRIERPERGGEMLLKEEIDRLKKELGKLTEANANGDSSHNPSEQYDNLLEQIRVREEELDDLICVFDDKVRFGHKSGARPGSGSSRASSDYPSVRSSSSEKSSRPIEFADRNRSRGIGDSRGRSKNENGAFRASRDSGVLESRRMDRPNSRERW